MRTISPGAYATSACVASLALAACADQGYSVIASTATTIGVGLAQQPANGTLDATLGYKRAEFALVPTNRASAASQAGGARDSANVIMELRYSGIFSAGADSGIYQRLAIGETAVQQPGAALMLSRGNDGNVDPRVAAAVAGIPVASTLPAGMQVLSDKYLDYRTKKDDAAIAKFNKAARDAGYTGFDDFYFHGKAADVPKVRQALEGDGITFN